MGLSVSVYVCACVCVTFVSTGRIIAKIKNVKITFVYIDICYRMASLRKLYSVILTYIFYFKCLKIVKFVRFLCYRIAKIMKKINQNTFNYLRLNGVSYVFLLRDPGQHFRFQMFKISEIRSFSYVARS